MIEKIHIQNFKCLRDVEVELGPFNVLIGPNDSGKSSFLQAIELLRGLSSQKFEFSRTLVWNRNKDLKVMISVDGISDVRDSISFELPVTPKFVDHLRQVHERRTGSKSLCDHLGSSVTYRLDPRSLRKVARSKNDPTSKADGSELEPLSETTEMENDPTLKPDGSNLALVLDANASGPDRQAVLDLEKKLNEAVPTLKGISTPTAGGPGAYSIEFTLNVDTKPPVTVPSKQASDGAMLLLAFLVIVHGNSPDILLIEEPENGLHPSRLKMVIEVLRKISKGEVGYKPRQIILTTHSPLLLNFVDPSEVRIFRRDPQKGTEIKAMDKIPNIERLSKDFAAGELWYLYGEDDLITGHAT